MNYRSYDPEQDREAVQRIWQEIKWIDRDDEDDAKAMEYFLADSRALVADVNGQAECLVVSAPGTLLHLEQELKLGIVSAVTTSLLARKLGLASRLTAELIALDAENGAEVAALGMFEQGFYSRLGFGTGPYEHNVHFNPAHLSIHNKAGTPERLGEEHYADIHNALLKRWRGHGSVQVLPLGHTQSELIWTEDSCGFGYRNDAGELTHFIWGELKDEHGPLKITALAYRDREQLLELLALIRNLGDQIYKVSLVEPLHIQLQDVIEEPFRNQNISEGGKFEQLNSAEAFWQIRINNLEACLGKTKLYGQTELKFNLALQDPITEFLSSSPAWQGIGGDYTVSLGTACHAEKGLSDSLPTLKASVGGFSRLWLGCANANSLASSGEISGPQSLIDDLEKSLRLPLPKTGWDF